MKILINDHIENKDEYFKIFGRFGYENNELLFSHSFETAKEFILSYLEVKKGPLDLIITNSITKDSKDILKANELAFFKNNLITSYSKSDFRISSIPTILFSNNETKSKISYTGFNAIIQKNTFDDHTFFVQECERVIRGWRQLVLNDLEVLGVKIKQLTAPFQLCPNPIHNLNALSSKTLDYFAHKTKVVSLEFIQRPTYLNYDWIRLNNNKIEEAILKYIKTYKGHVKYDRNNGERAILHEFFKNNRTIMLRDTYSDMEYELTLSKLDAKNREQCDFILKTQYPDFLNTTFFEVKKEDVRFYVKKNTKRPQISSEFLSHLQQVWGYKEFANNPLNKVELSNKLEYETSNFDFVLLAGRQEEKEEMKDIFAGQINRMFEGIKVITYDELEEVNINYLDKFNRLRTQIT